MGQRRAQQSRTKKIALRQSAAFRPDFRRPLRSDMSLPIVLTTALISLALLVFIIFVIKRVLSTSTIDVLNSPEFSRSRRNWKNTKRC